MFSIYILHFFIIIVLFAILMDLVDFVVNFNILG